MSIHVSEYEEVTVTYYVGGETSPSWSLWIVPDTIQDAYGSMDIVCAEIKKRLPVIPIVEGLVFWHKIESGPVYFTQSEVIKKYRALGPHFTIGRIRESAEGRELEIRI